MAGWTWDQVVSMMGGGPGSEGGRGYAPLQEVRAYWEGLRDGPGLPARAAVDPRGLERALEYVFMLERIAPGIARFRLAGMHLTALMGMEVRGMPLSALFDPPARTASLALLEAVFDQPAVVELALEAERGIGRPALEGRMLLLPLLGDEGVCDRVLGCLVTLGTIGRNPRRFAIARQTTTAVSGGVATLPVRPRVQPVPIPGLAEPTASFDRPRPGTPATRRAPHLRLVKSDD